MSKPDRQVGYGMSAEDMAQVVVILKALQGSGGAGAVLEEGELRLYDDDYLLGRFVCSDDDSSWKYESYVKEGAR